MSLTRSDWFGGMERTKVPSYPAKTPRRKRSPSLSPLVKLKVKSSRFNCNCLEMYFRFYESLPCTFGTKQQGNPHWTLLWVLHSVQGANLRRFFRTVANYVPIQSPYDKKSKHVHHAVNRTINIPQGANSCHFERSRGIASCKRNSFLLRFIQCETCCGASLAPFSENGKIYCNCAIEEKKLIHWKLVKRSSWSHLYIISIHVRAISVIPTCIERLNHASFPSLTSGPSQLASW